MGLKKMLPAVDWKEGSEHMPVQSVEQIFAYDMTVGGR
jgi:hypothetical protein